MNHVFATRTFVTGAGHTVVLGAHYPTDDPVVIAHPECFTDDARYGLSSSRPLGADGYPLGMETATAGPGEKRTRSRVSKPRAKKAPAEKPAPAPATAAKAEPAVVETATDAPAEK